MFSSNGLLQWLTLALIAPLVASVEVTDIQGPAFQSPLVGQSVSNVTGVVTAKSSSGFYITGTPSANQAVSNGVYVYSTSSKVLKAVNVGDLVSLGGKIQEYRPAADPAYLTGTELSSPANITVLSSNNTIPTVVLGKDRIPPTQQLSALDVGRDGWLSVPNNQSLTDVVNATAKPSKFGLDFWSSLEGQLVTVPKPISIGFDNQYGEFWVRGKWPATGINGRGGLSLVVGPDGLPDAQPETVIIGSPLDGTKNPPMAIGKTLSDITGVVQYQFGFYYILPLTAATVLTIPDATVPPTKLTSPSFDPFGCTVTVGDYNVDNFGPTVAHLPAVASHIATELRTPDIMFLQEIQDNDGEKDDGIVDASATLTALTAKIANTTGWAYNYTYINGINNQDGGVPGGNIRPAYLFNTKKVSLVSGAPAGGALDATTPVRGRDGRVSLTFNPGRIDPTNLAWNSSRKPLVAEWQTHTGQRFFTINVHNAAKISGGGSTTQGDPRPPINGVADQRTLQVQTIATFVKSLLKLDPLASIIIAGDFNEFVQTRSVFQAFDNLVFEADALANIPAVERYTYSYQNTMEQLDHIFVSPSVALRGVDVEHVHVNSWAPSYDDKASDHDPSVARVKVCLL